MDLENVKIDATLEKEITEYQGFKMSVDDEQSKEIAMAEVLSIGSLIKKIDAWFKPLVEQAHASHKALTSRRGEQIKPLEEKQAELKKSVSKYMTDQENARREAQRIADEAAAKLEAEAKAKREAEAKKLEQEAAALAKAGKAEEADAKRELAEVVREEPVMVVAQVVESVDKTTRFDGGTVSGQADIEIEVTDIKALLQAIVNGEIPQTVIEVKSSELKKWAKMFKATSGKGLTIREIVKPTFRGKTA